MKPTFEHVPDELKQRPQWVVWRWKEKRPGEWDKPLYDAKTGRYASSTNPSTWVDYETALKCYQSHNGTYGGLGYVFTADDPFCGIDYDDCRDKATGDADERVMDLINEIDSYTEISPSGTGFKQFAKAKLPGAGRKFKDIWKDSPVSIETYDTGRYFTITGQALNVVSQQVEDRQDETEKLYRWLDTRKAHADQQTQETGGEWDGEIKTLKVPYSIKFLIKHGAPEGERSEAGFSVLCSLVGAGYSDDVIFSVFNRFPIGEKYHSKGDGCVRWLSAEIQRAREKVSVKDRESGSKAQERKEAAPIEWIKGGDIEIKAPEFLIDDIIERDALIAGFGDYGSHKSFHAIDIALSVASGKGYHGHQVKQMPVFVFLGEGKGGIGRRLLAWCIRYGYDLKTLPIFISKRPAALIESGEAQRVIESVRTIIDTHGTPGLFIVDTVQRNFGFGDENSTADMSRFVYTLDLIRCEYRSSMLTVHHTGQQNKSRARGSIVLPASSDAEYRIEKDANEITRFLPIKMKDSPLFEPMAFKKVVVELPIVDQRGRRATSLILEETAYEPEPEPGKAGRGRWQVEGSRILRALYEEKGRFFESQGKDPDYVRVSVDEWRDRCIDAGMVRQTFYRVKKTLEDLGQVEIQAGFAHIM